MNIKTAVLMLAGAIAGIAAAGTAGAADGAGDVPTLVVKYSAATLATNSGAKTLYRKLQLAADQVCANPAAETHVSAAVAHCRQKALADAVARIDDSRLAAVYANSPNKG